MNTEIPSKELLESMMKELGSMGKVAVELRKPYGTVRTWFNKYRLDRPKSCSTIFHELRLLDFSKIQKSFVIGSILGDGGLQKHKKGKNATLKIKHCTKQLSYLIWKKKLLDPFSRSIYKTSEPHKVFINGVETVDSGSFAVYTVAHPVLTDFYDKYYINGKKRVPESIIEDLDLMALSVWMADDGSFYTNNKFKGVCAGKMCTNSFSYEEQLLLVEALKKFYGEEGISVIPFRRDKKEYVIKLTNSKATINLLSMARSILPKCIHYKLDPQRLHANPPINSGVMT